MTENNEGAVQSKMEKDIETILMENDFKVEKEKNIKGYLVDLVAKKGNKMVIVEIKNKPILTSSVINLYQLKKKLGKDVHFALVSGSGAYGDVGAYARESGICVYDNGKEFAIGVQNYSNK